MASPPIISCPLTIQACGRVEVRDTVATVGHIQPHVHRLHSSLPPPRIVWNRRNPKMATLFEVPCGFVGPTLHVLFHSRRSVSLNVSIVHVWATKVGIGVRKHRTRFTLRHHLLSLWGVVERRNTSLSCRIEWCSDMRTGRLLDVEICCFCVAPVGMAVVMRCVCYRIRIACGPLALGAPAIWNSLTARNR